jgi:hypothetical protein
MVALIRHASALFATDFTPLIDESIVPTTDVFFQPAMVDTTHLTISIARVDQ